MLLYKVTIICVIKHSSDLHLSILKVLHTAFKETSEILLYPSSRDGKCDDCSTKYQLYIGDSKVI